MLQNPSGVRRRLDVSVVDRRQLRRVLAGAVLLALALSACGDDDDTRVVAPPPTTSVTVDLSAPIGETSSRFLSVAVDSAQAVGGLWWDPEGSVSNDGGETIVPVYDFSRPRLLTLAAELAPAYLRIGGTAADRLYYDLSDTPGPTPEGYEFTLTREQWDGIHDFTQNLDFRLTFTLNGGDGARVEGRWDPSNARELIRYSVSRGTPVDVWELGNEPNIAFFFGEALDPEHYGEDLATARDLVREEAPSARLLAASTAFFPTLLGDLGWFSRFLELSDERPDLYAWHYYPQQSVRCADGLRDVPAGPEVMLDPNRLDEIKRWEATVGGHARSEGADVWLGETGNAQCGGQPGTSDTWAGTFWWIDQLGTLARLDHKVVIRQTLSGSNYGLIDDVSLEPWPDYWASVLWKRLMGTDVLEAASQEATLRVYAHCTAESEQSESGSITVTAINIDQTRTHSFASPYGDAEVYLLTADSLGSQTVMLNGDVLALDENDEFPALRPQRVRSGFPVELPPLSIAFVVYPDSAAPACR